MFIQTQSGSAMQALEGAFTEQRKEWYGMAWELVDWYGIPLPEIPEPERTDLAKWIRTK